jgi:hypothetical protein
VGRAAGVADQLLAWEAEVGEVYPALFAAPQKARVLALRGENRAARSVMHGITDRCLAAGDLQVIAPALTTAALIEHLDGHSGRARQRLAELGRAATSPIAPIAEICRILIACDATNDARAIAGQITAQPPRTMHALASIHAMLAEADTDHATATTLYRDAASRWRSFGNPLELAHALAGQARNLSALSHADQAATHGSEAASIFQRLGVRDHTSLVDQ